MIEADKRKAIYLLHQEGMSIRQIALRLGVSRNTVRRVIQQQGQMPAVTHADKLHVDEQLLRAFALLGTSLAPQHPSHHFPG